jgi:hypothetical protein
MTPPRTIDKFFKERGTPLPSNIPPLIRALQILHLYHEIKPWYYSNIISRRPLALHTRLLATEVEQDLEFYLGELPEDVYRGYRTILFSAGRRIVQSDHLLAHLIQRVETCHFNGMLLMNLEDLVLLLRYEEDHLLVIDGNTGIIYSESSLEGCISHIPKRAMNAVPATIGINALPL